MRREIRLVWVIALLCVSAVIFVISDYQLAKSIATYQQEYQDAADDLTALENENTLLQESLATSNTDAFIEHTARTLYGYMTTDEVSFSITNAQALYGSEGVPDR